ncbi:hypothetical protein Y032_0669g1359 [Ancylostoma ceylanicum]|uniref:Uncharacterized protein n=1 Tax=Ancylostoma ceylanicum TaxID=53326 RepID=A0A016WHA3_9BILA|nr:hypothetical protein Y032_0669g1359 [Ancylostoma ceylanicum]
MAPILRGRRSWRSPLQPAVVAIATTAGEVWGYSKLFMVNDRRDSVTVNYAMALKNTLKLRQFKMNQNESAT